MPAVRGEKSRRLPQAPWGRLRNAWPLRESCGIIFGPNSWTADFGIHKNFTIVPDRDIRIQVRAEMFNLFNHPNFDNPDLRAMDLLRFPEFIGLVGVPDDVCQWSKWTRSTRRRTATGAGPGTGPGEANGTLV